MDHRGQPYLRHLRDPTTTTVSLRCELVQLLVLLLRAGRVAGLAVVVGSLLLVVVLVVVGLHGVEHAEVREVVFRSLGVRVDMRVVVSVQLLHLLCVLGLGERSLGQEVL